MIAVGLISDFATKVIDGLRTTPMSRVVIPPGRSEEEARRELSMAASELGYGCAQIDLSSVGRLDDLFVSLSDELGCSGSASDIDEFLDKARELYQPRVVLLAGQLDREMGSSILNMARVLADVTRDLVAPIRFVWVHDASQLRANSEIPFEVWPGEWRDIPQLAFAEALDVVLNRALDLYVNLRIYWECAGQPDRIRHLTDVVSTKAVFFAASRNVDDTLEKIFDSTPVPEADRRALVDQISEVSHREHCAKALGQDVFPRADVRLIQQWHAAGVVWRPPGMSRWRLTPVAVRLFLQDVDQAISNGIGVEALRLRLVVARANPQLSQMVLILTTQVEGELLDALRRETKWVQLIESAGLRNDLERQKQRSTSTQDFFYRIERSLLDYATFGQLVRIAQAAGSTFKFPLSRELLWDLASLRNLAAHGCPVRWEGLRHAIEAVSVLAM